MYSVADHRHSPIGGVSSGLIAVCKGKVHKNQILRMHHLAPLWIALYMVLVNLLSIIYRAIQDHRSLHKRVLYNYTG